MPNADSLVLPSEIYQRSSTALETLGQLWNTSTDVIKAITDVTASTLRSEPDYQTVQAIKKKHDQVLNSLKSELKWIEDNQKQLDFSKSDDSEKQLRIAALEQEQQELRAESQKLTAKVRQLLEQSYTLQHHLGLLLTSSEDLSSD
ncbi:hypothetical protein K450DRAFT_233510 [Umbelopsis ramanniana AG]|uniref:Uncharacterized protein n=1 Tax=Umbelopsis ramanniana AG TaxID=1314678 RepID=A0AAD5EE06_UMBRA|nr:uncharacterized protein K450DRAFT_233510 [Umbelopsis ramanniana AG]KAI8581186.1 hypothetical protein K450DRAFT_233510 [Umbelopsis ramanniana AG]